MGGRGGGAQSERQTSNARESRVGRAVPHPLYIPSADLYTATHF